MDFALSTEQEDLAAGERAWLTKNDPVDARRPSLDDGPAHIHPPALAHVAESGLIGLRTEDAGGSHVDLAVLVEEHGRAGSSVPLAELALGAAALAGVEALAPHAEAAIAGAAVIPLVIGPVDGVPLAAEIDETRLRLRGTTAPSPGLLDATGFAVVTTTSTGTDVIAYVAAETPGARVRPLRTLDLTRGWGALELDITLEAGEWASAPVGAAAAGSDALAVFRKMDAIGAAERLLRLTVEYACQRTQFGKPIGAFQAVKHHCANMALAVESARAALWAAAVTLDGDDADRRAHVVSSAAAYAGEATATTAQLALQVHGGIGFTWEHIAHLLIRRTKVDELLNGSATFHRRRLMRA